MFLSPVLQWSVRALAFAVLGIVICALVTEALVLWEQLVAVGIGTVVPLVLLTVHGKVRVSDEHLHLALRPFWWKRIPLDDVVSAHVGEVDPLSEIGAFGYRRRGYLTVLALRKGAAVHFGTRGGERYTVGGRDAAGLVAALQRSDSTSS